MNLLEAGRDVTDMELQVYAMTLVNKTLNGVPDQDTYYDHTDFIEELGMETLVQRYFYFNNYCNIHGFNFAFVYSNMLRILN